MAGIPPDEIAEAGTFLQNSVIAKQLHRLAHGMKIAVELFGQIPDRRQFPADFIFLIPDQTDDRIDDPFVDKAVLLPPRNRRKFRQDGFEFRRHNSRNFRIIFVRFDRMV